MKILFIGDIVGETGFDLLKSGGLDNIIKEHDINFVIANGENINKYNGITAKEAEDLHYTGVDVITTGNHAFRHKSIYSFLDDSDYIIRPANLPHTAAGKGFTTINTPYGKIGVINLMGQVEMDPVDNPFHTADKLLSQMKDCKYIFVDFHAEATSEKKAMGYYLDGRVTGVFGTHTHIQTADEQILPQGTAYITDVGMTGPQDSVLGVKKELAIQRFTTRMYTLLEQTTECAAINAIVVDVEKKKIFRIR
ncbi:MAG: ymdB [Clostridia bacterium]|nr:ymdB [Clostridia bacterium]